MRKRFSFIPGLILISLFAGTASAYTPPPLPTFTIQKLVIPYTSVTGKWWSGLAISNESNYEETYYLTVYDETGAVVGSGCLTIDAHAIHTAALQDYLSLGEDIQGHVSIHIRTTISQEPFSATLFMGNTAESQGFGFQSFRSEESVTHDIIFCDGPPLL
jgi:hypothetical protein